MNQQQQSQLNAICNTVLFIIESYHEPEPLLKRVFNPAKKRTSHAKHICNTVESILAQSKPASDYTTLLNELVLSLDNFRYFFSVKTRSQRLREKIQDAMLATINFMPSDVNFYQQLIENEGDIPAYLQRFQKHEELQIYRDYFATRHDMYGFEKEMLGEEDLTIAAKGGLINGKLVSHFGFPFLAKRNLKRITQELQVIIDKKINKGFLTAEVAQGYIDKINILLESDPENIPDDETFIQQGRYILENITNAAGVKHYGPAKHLEYAVLITACYWVDEFFIQAKAKVDYELT